MEIPSVTADENSNLTAPFTEKEVKEAMFHMDHNKSSVFQ